MGLLVFFLFVANGFGAGRETFVTFGCCCFFQVFVDFCVSKFFFPSLVVIEGFSFQSSAFTFSALR